MIQFQEMEIFNVTSFWQLQYWFEIGKEMFIQLGSLQMHICWLLVWNCLQTCSQQDPCCYSTNKIKNLLKIKLIAWKVSPNNPIVIALTLDWSMLFYQVKCTWTVLLLFSLWWIWCLFMYSDGYDHAFWLAKKTKLHSSVSKLG